jgi:hypothetical protein
MSYPVRRSTKRRILSTALLLVLMIIYIGVAPASRSSAAPAKKSARPCDCFNEEQWRDGVLVKYADGIWRCDPIC